MHNEECGMACMYDFAIIGGGILGTALAYQLSKESDGTKIAVLEKENEVAQHTSGRNTGVLHRPFYLDPETKGKFARVDFGAFTRALRDDAVQQGVQFIMGKAVNRVREDHADIEIECGAGEIIRTRYLINCAGGSALKIAHWMGVARDYADLNFRGEYLIVGGASERWGGRNIYCVPRHSEFSFLDPHFVVRHDGRTEIGPTAVPVFGAYAYRGLGKVWSKIAERPVINKLRLCVNPEFLRLCAQEWRSVLSPRAMVSRVQKFLPDLRVEDCVTRGTAGVRASLVDQKGQFVPEVVEVQTAHSLHILNYNSPGASGAPAYAKEIMRYLQKGDAV